MSITLIPLTKLAASSRNVRKMEADKCDDLKASIKAMGLLNNLQVVEVGKGKKTHYEVIAGGRRLRALQELQQEGVIAADYEVICQIVADEAATEVSLAENAIRVNMHPADQYIAFKQLADEGKCPADIAARFGVSEQTVQQRLKLAMVSPMLMEAYKHGEMTLDQLMGFTVSDDQANQESVWEVVKSRNWNNSGKDIRRALTESTISIHDRRALYIGEQAYQDAGGHITRDLFTEEAYLEEPEVLNRLLTEKVVQLAAEIKAEGWGWCEADLLCQKNVREYNRIEGGMLEMNEADAAELARLDAENEQIAESHQNQEIGWEEAEELQGAIEEAIAALNEKYFFYEPAMKARTGVLIRLDKAGEVILEKGLLRPQDKTVGDAEAEEAAKEAKKGEKPRISAKLLEELTAHQSRAIAYTLAENPETALTALLHTLTAKPDANRYFRETCLEMGDLSTKSYGNYETVKGSLAHLALEEKADEWASIMPQDDAERWNWLAALDDMQRKALLAYCVSSYVNAVSCAFHSGKAYRKTPILIQHVLVDMTQFWEPTAANYFSRVGKTQITDAVREVAGEREANHIAGKKKHDAAAYAERLLAGKGWLPPELRLADYSAENFDLPEDEHYEEDEATFTEDEIAEAEAA